MPSTGTDGQIRRRVSALATAGGSGPPIAGYFAWYDAAGITGVADGTALATWADRSANGLDLTQSTVAKRPTYYATTTAKLVNKLPAVWFSNAPTAMANSSFPAHTTFTSFATFVSTPAPTGQTAVWYDNQSSATAVFLNATGYTFQMGAQSPEVTATPSTTVPAVVTAWHDSTTVHVSLNDGTPVTATTSGQIGVGLVVGAFQDQTLIPFKGPICELIFYPSALAAGDITATVNYLTAKWG